MKQMSKQNGLIHTDNTLIVASRLGGERMAEAVKGIRRYRLTVLHVLLSVHEVPNITHLSLKLDSNYISLSSFDNVLVSSQFLRVFLLDIGFLADRFFFHPMKNIVPLPSVSIAAAEKSTAIPISLFLYIMYWFFFCMLVIFFLCF